MKPARDWPPPPARLFAHEEWEIICICDEVIADLATRPMERFYLCETLMLAAVMVGHYAKDQVVLDWLFDLRRASCDNLEGTTRYDARDRRHHNQRREPILPGTVCHS